MLRSISERFNVGRSTALKITRRVVSALIELAPLVIKWPKNERIDQVWTGFVATSGFPKVIGAIDGTHINIPAPKDNPEAYVNRKGHHSIQLQVLCCSVSIIECPVELLGLLKVFLLSSFLFHSLEKISCVFFFNFVKQLKIIKYCSS